MEHRDSRDTRFPPGLASNQPYEYGGRTYQYKSEYISTLFVDQTGVISDVNVGRIDVFRVPYERNDAIVGTLTSPSGMKVQLFSWACGAGASGGNAISMHITLDDNAEAEVPYSCTDNFSGVFKPAPDRLSRVKGEEAKGNWILQMDRYSDDENPGGFFNKWELGVCTTR
jgi:subtilisin-like proprotein convertase family protein